jgi:Grap2 and cyclin-D-interacting
MESDGRGGGGGRVDDAAPDSIVSSMAALSCHQQDEEEEDTAATTNTNADSTELKNENPLSILKMIQKLDETIAVLQQQQPPPLTSSSSTIPTSLPMEFLTHYHHIPPSVQQIYDTLLHGATLIHGTVTKYTLMGQMEQNHNNNYSTAQIPYLQDLLQGCRMVTACVMTMHHPHLGCSRSVQNHTRTAVRAIVRSVVQLIQVFVVDVMDHHGNHQHQHRHASLPAQRTGVVWSYWRRNYPWGIGTRCDEIYSPTGWNQM